LPGAGQPWFPSHIALRFVALTAGALLCDFKSLMGEPIRKHSDLSGSLGSCSACLDITALLICQLLAALDSFVEAYPLGVRSRRNTSILLAHHRNNKTLVSDLDASRSARIGKDDKRNSLNNVEDKQ
jgi:hypothetical protein